MITTEHPCMGFIPSTELRMVVVLPQYCSFHCSGRWQGYVNVVSEQRAALMFAASPRYCLTRMTDCGVNFLNTSNIIFVAVHMVTRDSLATISLVTLLEGGTLLRARFHLRNERVEDRADVCCTSPMRPHFLHNDANYGVNHHLRFVTVCGLRVVCIPTISYLHRQNKPKNS